MLIDLCEFERGLGGCIAFTAKAPEECPRSLPCPSFDPNRRHAPIRFPRHASHRHPRVRHTDKTLCPAVNRREESTSQVHVRIGGQDAGTLAVLEETQHPGHPSRGYFSRPSHELRGLGGQQPCRVVQVGGRRSALGTVRPLKATRDGQH